MSERKDETIPVLSPPGRRRPAVAPDPAVRAAVELLGGPTALTVLVNDPQRDTASAAVLSALARLTDSRNIRLLVATGTHKFPPAVRRDFEARLRGGLPFGPIAWHDSRRDRLADVGGRWRGHPWLLEDPPLLAVGSVEPHYFAGFTGAHKTLTIGCAAYDDVEANHADALHPFCRPCQLEGNAVHEGVAGMLRALTRARRNRASIAAVNLVQAETNILVAFGGDPMKTLRQAAPAARDCFVCRATGRADALVAEVSGPLARSFYQADKAIKNNEWAVRDGGCMVLVADCPDGIGQDHFVALLRRAPTHAQAVARVRRRGYRLGDHKAVRLRYLTDPACRGVKVVAVSSGLTDDEAAVLGMTRAETVTEALASCGVRAGRDRVFRLPDAGNTCLLTAGN